MPYNVWYGKTRMALLRGDEKKFGNMFIHFDTIPACGRQISCDNIVELKKLNFTQNSARLRSRRIAHSL